MAQPDRLTTSPIGNAFMRVAGVDAPLGQLLANAQTRGMPVSFVDIEPTDDIDYAMIDTTLAVAHATDLQQGDSQPPLAGLGYAGFTPTQRAAFLSWLQETTGPAPPAFRQLYLANLEAHLLADRADLARSELLRLQSAPAWRGDRGLAAATWLGLWLAQDGGGIAAWLAQPGIHEAMLGVALGSQALLGTCLQVAQLRTLFDAWRPVSPTPSAALLALRLSSLTTALGADPLMYALKNLDEQECAPRLWRCTHRGLRLFVPQPDLQPVLDPLLHDMLSVGENVIDENSEPEETALDANVDEADDLTSAHLILEFGHSRSEFFSWALHKAQKQRGFTQLLDENRQLVYRVPFRRNEMRRFWQLWDAVQGWSSTRIYSGGQTLEKWQVYPYSQYLR